MSLYDHRQFEKAREIQSLHQAGQADPRDLHDALRAIVDALESERAPVPPVFRRTLQELEADIAEAYFNNVPI